MRLLRSGTSSMTAPARRTVVRAAIPGLLLALILFPATLAASGTSASTAPPQDDCGFYSAMLSERGGLA